MTLAWIMSAPYAVGTGVTVGGVAAELFCARKADYYCGRWSKPALCEPTYSWKLGPAMLTLCTTPGGDWPLIAGVLRVEVKYADDSWHPVTQGVVGLGICARLAPTRQRRRR